MAGIRFVLLAFSNLLIFIQVVDISKKVSSSCFFLAVSAFRIARSLAAKFTAAYSMPIVEIMPHIIKINIIVVRVYTGLNCAGFGISPPL